MMYRKALLFGDSATAAEILRSDTPRRAKDLGRTVRGFEELTWREHRARIVVEGNLAKFNQNDRLRQYLLGTRDALLAEASPCDRIWGIGLAATDPRARDPARWRGENQLGTSLMEVRTQLKREFSAPPPELARGDLLHAATEALVNPVNTRGVMGKGLALQFKRAYPANFAAYARACARNELQPGGIFVTEQEAMPRVIMNVATKAHWRDPSQLRYVQDGLNNIVSRTRALQVRSIAIPALGCGEGGLRWTEVKPLLERAAAQISNVRVVLFEPQRALEAEQRRGLPNKGIDLDR
jgi:ribA/ribD-fused uncharacterized protein